MPTSLLPALLLFFAPPDGSVEVRGDSPWIRPLYPAPDLAQAQGPWAARREVSVELLEDGRLRVSASWQLRAHEPGWFTARLAPARPDLRLESVRWDGRAASVSAENGGLYVTGFVREASRVTASWTLEGRPDRGGVDLELFEAVSGELSVEGLGELVPSLTAGGTEVPAVAGSFWTGAERLHLSVRTAEESLGGAEQVVVARTGIGLTVGDAELRGRARVRWEVLRGRLDAVELQVAQLGRDLAIDGPNVRTWTRDGDVIRIELQQPTQDVVEASLRWSKAVPPGTESTLPVAEVSPRGVFRSELALQLARDGEVELLPHVEGATAVAARQLPTWGSGLVEGTPSTAYLGTAATGDLDLLRFEPVSGPPVVIDVAAYTVATSREGRALVSGRLEVRNERASHLRITPPDGMRVLGVRVAGETALPARDPSQPRTWLVPLRRSVESVEGLISFPVEVSLLGDGEAWSRKTERELIMPAYDAPVAASRVTLHLPPGHHSRLEEGEGGTVASFSEGEGITYGFSAGDDRAAAADALFQRAVEDWMNNDFEAAQDKMAELREIGAGNENIDRLEANLMVIEGEAGGDVDERMARRVKSQAQARAQDDYAEQSEKIAKAKELAAEGRFDEARAEYEQAAQIGEDLAKLEQRESVEQQFANAEVARELEALEEARRQQEAIADYGVREESDRGEDARARDFKTKGKRDRKGGRRNQGSVESLPDQGELGWVGDESGAYVDLPPADPVSATAPATPPPPPVSAAQQAGEGALVYEVPEPPLPVTRAPDVRQFDFDEDSLDGELLSPAGADLSARARSRHSSVVDLDRMGPGVDQIQLEGGDTPLEGVDGGGGGGGGGYGVEFEPEPVPEPEPIPEEPAAYDEPVEAERIVLEAESTRPLAGVAVSDRARRATRRGGVGRAKRGESRKQRGTGAAAGSAAPDKPAPMRPAEMPSAAEDPYMVDDLRSIPVGSSSSRDFTTTIESSDGAVAGDDLAVADELEELSDEDKEATGLERLPEPEVTASELNLAVPTVGEAVLYQRLLLPAGEHLSVRVEARAPRKRIKR